MSVSAAQVQNTRPVEIDLDGMADLSAVLAWFGDPTEKPTQREAQRWANCLPGGQARKDRNRWRVHVEARLPDGLTVESFLRCGKRAEQYAGQPLPPGSEHWSTDDWKRYDDTLELRRRYDEMRLSFKSLNKDAFARVFEKKHGEWGNGRGLSLKRKQLDNYFARIDPQGRRFDGNVDRRGRKRTDDGAEPCSPEAWGYFKTLYLDPRRRSVALCYEVVAVEAERSGWRWSLGLRSVQRRVDKELPAFIADYHRLGERRWAGKHAPRIERDLSDVRPNQVWVGDHCQLDFLARLEGGEIKRPWVTAWMDQRSRMIVGWVVTSSPDSDTILAAFRDAVVEHGAPEQIIIDNGKDYRAKGFSGGRRGKPRLDTQRVLSVCGRLGIHVTFCEPFNPGSKAIERFFDTLHERFDKTFPTYCGNRPENRPEQLFARLRARKVAEPTTGAIREQLPAWLDAYHRRPHAGDSMDGKSPLYVFTHCDPIARRTAPRDVLDKLLQKTAEVKVTKRGVRYHDIYYGQDNPEVWKRRGSTVTLRVDPERADAVEVCELDGRHITWAANARLGGMDQDDIKAGKRRQKQARKLAQAALPAIRDARKTTEQHVIAAQREHAEQLAKAAGAEGMTPPRGVQLLPGAAEIARHGVVSRPAPAADESDAALDTDDLSLLGQDGQGDHEAVDVDEDDSDLSLLSGDDFDGLLNGSGEPVADLLQEL